MTPTLQPFQHERCGPLCPACAWNRGYFDGYNDGLGSLRVRSTVVGPYQFGYDDGYAVAQGDALLRQLAREVQS